MHPAERSLSGRRVLLTRPPDRAASLVAALERHGARVEARSAIAFESLTSSREVRRAVEHLPDYHWIVFTSPTGVRFFDERTRAAGVDASAGNARVVAIGRATGAALSRAGLPPEIVATASHSEGLARELLTRVSSGQRVLLVRPERSAETVPRALRDAGLEVDAVAFYRTVASADAPALAGDVAAGAYDVVVVTSPSNLSSMLGVGDPAIEDVARGLAAARRVAIGPTTAAALGDAGLPAHATAGSPDDEGIVDAVLRAVSA